jgi:hypothetical protein
MSNVLAIGTGEGEPRGEFRMRREGLADGFGFGERWQRFKCEQIGDFSSLRFRESLNSLGMEFDEIVEGTGLVAVVFGAVVECCAVGTERSGNDDASIRKGLRGFAGECDGAKECGVGTVGGETDLGIAHARNLVACCFDDVGAGFDIGAMNSDNFLGSVFEDVGGPERDVDVGSEIFEFGGHAAVEDVDAVEEGFAHAHADIPNIN